MISVEEALKLIQSNCLSLKPEMHFLYDSTGLILAKDVVSPINMPPFRQSAMDGYALNFQSEIKTYQIVGEIAAGSAQKFNLQIGEAVRIFTGSAVPDSANTVIQQEIVTRTANEINLTTDFLTDQNIRKFGEQIKVGEIALTKNTKLTPAATGHLASLGIDKVSVIPHPKIGLLTTGNELVEPGNKLEHGQIFESNSTMIVSALEEHHFNQLTKLKTKDDLEATKIALQKLLNENNVVLISGGISVGDYDFVKTALNELGVKEIFYKVKQKPGKPLFFGTFNHKLIFALPGNPAAALTCFYLYVLPALQKISGKEFIGLKKVKRKFKSAYSKKSGLAHFLKSNADEDFVTISEGQSSAMLQTFAVANAITFIPESVEQQNTNDLVDVYLLD